MQSYWLSFVDPDLPEGSRFLGVSIVRAEHPKMAVPNAWGLGCNPGGEVMIFPIPQHLESRIEDAYRNRVLSREECGALDIRLTES